MLEEVRQSHYAAGDELHASQGRYAEAQLEVSRLEERIRFVVESRTRAQARLAELHAFAAIDVELKKLYEALAERDLAAGSAAARRLFS